ncbi:hypothetical protein RF11_06532 [Thelohanellus kitauei]|uniref:Uncharacterized protein n=1 Tax=Thelohanellus kitauei TaxID=669202 RepID=A0A0C2ING6_THEKT|nr:hypothetical protein RF11_06532 [Thelohanellus kitauei]
MSVIIVFRKKHFLGVYMRFQMYTGINEVLEIIQSHSYVQNIFYQLKKYQFMTESSIKLHLMQSGSVPSDHKERLISLDLPIVALCLESVATAIFILIFK